MERLFGEDEAPVGDEDGAYTAPGVSVGPQALTDAERAAPGGDFLVGELRVVLFEGVHGLHDLLEAPEDASFAGAEQFLEGVGHGGSPSVGCGRRRVPPGTGRDGARHNSSCYPAVTFLG